MNPIGRWVRKHRLNNLRSIRALRDAINREKSDGVARRMLRGYPGVSKVIVDESFKTLVRVEFFDGHYLTSHDTFTDVAVREASRRVYVHLCFQRYPERAMPRPGCPYGPPWNPEKADVHHV